MLSASGLHDCFFFIHRMLRHMCSHPCQDNLKSLTQYIIQVKSYFGWGNYSHVVQMKAISSTPGGRRVRIRLSYRRFHSSGPRTDPCGTPYIISIVLVSTNIIDN